MAEEPDDSDEFIEVYRAHLGRVDELVHVVLNAHFDIEAALDSFLDVMFYNPEHLQDARLTYLQKAHISRAYNELSNNRPEWRLMLVLNSLRNDIAHGDKSERRATKIDELRNIMLGLGTEGFRASVRTANDKDVVVYAAAMASGFLLIMEEQLMKIRRPREESNE